MSTFTSAGRMAAGCDDLARRRCRGGTRGLCGMGSWWIVIGLLSEMDRLQMGYLPYLGGQWNRG